MGPRGECDLIGLIVKDARTRLCNGVQEITEARAAK